LLFVVWSHATLSYYLVLYSADMILFQNSNMNGGEDDPFVIPIPVVPE